MDVLLETHGADSVRAPEGLTELLADISREVLRQQPTELYTFIADYTEALLITRENLKVAVKVVNYVLQSTENILSILKKHGCSLEKIAEIAPHLQSAFRDYLDTADLPCDEFCIGNEDDEISEISINNLLQDRGISIEEANSAAKIIQLAFRRHYQKMLFRESRGEIQWQRAVANTVRTMKKAGVSQREISESVPILMSVYKGYYTRRNQIKRLKEENLDSDPMKNASQAIAWLKEVSKDTNFCQLKLTDYCGEASTFDGTADVSSATCPLIRSTKVDLTKD